MHSTFTTVLASLSDSTLPPIDQNTAIFYRRQIVDDAFSGLAFEQEGMRCAGLLSDPKVKVTIMGNHGILIIRETVADAFNRMYHFERAAKTYVHAPQMGQPLCLLSHEIAEKTTRELEAYPDQAESHLAELKAILDEEGADCAS